MKMGILLLWHVDDKEDNLDTLMIAALVFGSLYISLAGTLNNPPLPKNREVYRYLSSGNIAEKQRKIA